MHPVCHVVEHLYNRITCILSKVPAQDKKIKKKKFKNLKTYIYIGLIRPVITANGYQRFAIY